MLLCRKRCLRKSQWKTLWLSFANPRKGRSSRSKTPVMESLFNKFAGLQLYLKKSPAQVLSCKILQIFKNNLFFQKTSGGCFCERTILVKFLQLQMLQKDAHWEKQWVTAIVETFIISLVLNYFDLILRLI